MSFWYISSIYYYGTSSWIVFVHVLGELKTPKRHFEINLPLSTQEKDIKGSDLAHIFGDLSQTEKLSEIKPALVLKSLTG